MAIRKIYNALYMDPILRLLVVLLMAGLFLFVVLPESWLDFCVVPYGAIFVLLLFRFVYVCVKVARGGEVAPLNSSLARTLDVVEKVALLSICLLFLGSMISYVWRLIF